MEVWKDIEGYNWYQVSDLGRVRSKPNSQHRKEIILSQIPQANGYLRVRLFKDGKGKLIQVSHLVADAFVLNPNNLPQVNHIDENVKNNRADNLEWCNAQYNCNFGTRNRRIADALSKEVQQFSKDGVLIKVFKSMSEAERETGVNHSYIARCCKGKCLSANGFVWRYA